MTTATPEELPSYEVKIVLKTTSNPNRWISQVVADALSSKEELIHCTVTEVKGV